MDKSNLNKRNIQLHIQLSGTETETSTPYPSRNKNVLPTIDQMKGFPIPNLADGFIVALCNIHFDLFYFTNHFSFFVIVPYILCRFFSLPIINPIQKLKKGIDPAVFSVFFDILRRKKFIRTQNFDRHRMQIIFNRILPPT